MRVAELESLFTADTAKFDKGAKDVEAAQKRIEAKETSVRIDAEIDKAQKKFDKITGDLDVLRHLDITPEVTADIAKAEANLSKVEANLGSLQGAKAKIDVQADTSGAEADLDGLADKAAAAGADGGERAGAELGTKIIAALATIPIAGAVIGVGQAIGDALLEGLGNEVRGDVLAARTGLDAATVARLGQAAGEAYAGNFGESIEANMETARAAVETGLLDPQSTAQDAQSVIQSLSGVADILGEDIPNVARAAGQILRTGLAKDAQGAFDLIVKGQQAGLNVSEDLLDTFNEYGTQFRKLGLEGPEALGLVAQAVQAGARDTDVAADALKEFSIRAIDDSALTAEGFEAVGLSAEDMAAKIAKGGPEAADALDQTLDGLRAIKDPADRSAAAVALFGTQAEDLGEALYSMDLTSAVKQLGSVEGAAQSALDTLGDNTAGKLESAKRNIEVAADGIQGALATAFAPEIQSGADWVTNNREAVVTFLFDAADAAIGFGIALVEGAAAGTEAFGDFIGTTGPAVLEGIDAIVQGLGRIGLISDEEAQSFADFTDGAVQGMKDFDESTEKTAEQIRTALIENALTPAQEKLDNLRIPAEAAAALSDATNRLAGDIGGLGTASDGSRLSLQLMNGQIDTSTSSGRQLDKQLQGVKSSLYDQVGAAAAAGESQNQLRGRVRSARDAFIDQVTALGLTRGEAGRLANQYGLIPKKVLTDINADGSQAKGEARSVRAELAAIKDRTVTVTTIRREAFERAQINDNRNRAGFATGGWVYGPGTATSDSIDAKLSVGEFVVNAKAAASNREKLEEINSGARGFANGGPVQSERSLSVTVNNLGGDAAVRAVTRAVRREDMLELTR